MGGKEGLRLGEARTWEAQLASASARESLRARLNQPEKGEDEGGRGERDRRRKKWWRKGGRGALGEERDERREEMRDLEREWLGLERRRRTKRRVKASPRQTSGTQPSSPRQPACEADLETPKMERATLSWKVLKAEVVRGGERQRSRQIRPESMMGQRTAEAMRAESATQTSPPRAPQWRRTPRALEAEDTLAVMWAAQEPSAANVLVRKRSAEEVEMVPEQKDQE